MAITINEKHLYFDRNSSNKLQVLVALINAVSIGKNKEDILKRFEQTLEIFKVDGAGSYIGENKQFQSKYTPGMEFGAIKYNTTDKIELVELATKVYEGEISAQYYISVVMCNLVQIIDDKIVHPLKSILEYMKNNNRYYIEDKDIINIKEFYVNSQYLEESSYKRSITGLIDILGGTYFFEKDKKKLKLNTYFGTIDEVLKCVNWKSDWSVEFFKESYKTGKETHAAWVEFLTKENLDLVVLENRYRLKRVNSKEDNEINDQKEVSEELFVYGEESSSFIKLPKNRIIFGAPGTGKSYGINKFLDENKNDVDFERVTFHSNTSYAQFVGSYKPIFDKQKEKIVYEFIPGPFLRVWKNAIENSGKINVLVIEEINRANVAAVFGDVFQLLDRNESGESQYSIALSEDIKQYLMEKSDDEIVKKLITMKIPKNMYIWATMNSADQGVMPLDTAFKRRWNFEYIDINKGEVKIKNKTINLKPYKNVNWNDLRKAINEELEKFNINEDKLMGPYFLSEEELAANNIDEIFKSKVLMYLFQDVLKHNKSILFQEGINTYSKLVRLYDNEENIFVEGVIIQINKNLEEPREI